MKLNFNWEGIKSESLRSRGALKGDVSNVTKVQNDIRDFMHDP